MTGLLLLLLACAVEDAPENEAADACADQPVAPWSEMAEGIVKENCQPCHSSQAVERYGAPESVVFDTKEQVRALKDDILRVTDLEDPTMPPALQMSDGDAERLHAWLECGD